MRINEAIIVNGDLRRLWTVRYDFELTLPDVEELEDSGFQLPWWGSDTEFIIGYKHLVNPQLSGSTDKKSMVRWCITHRTPMHELSMETIAERDEPGAYFNLVTSSELVTQEAWREETVAMAALITRFEARRAVVQFPVR